MDMVPVGKLKLLGAGRLLWRLPCLFIRSVGHTNYHRMGTVVMHQYGVESGI
jgi:hypothetical protein